MQNPLKVGDFDESKIEVGVGIDDLSFQLSAAGKYREQTGIGAGYVRIGGDNAHVCDEEAGAGTAQRFQAHDSRLSAANEFFEREFGLKRSWLRSSGPGRNCACECAGDGFEIDVEMIGLEQPILAVMAAVKIIQSMGPSLSAISWITKPFRETRATMGCSRRWPNSVLVRWK
jgi:hypothetical protein